MKQKNKKNGSGWHWDDWLELAKNYYIGHGDLLIPGNYISANGKKLGRWISRQRIAYKGGVMTIDRVVALNAIHMVWEIMKMPRWKQSFELAAEYFRQNGDLAVPLEYKAEGYALGKWLYRQRRLRNQGLLTKEQIQQLEAIGMDWRIAAKNDWSVWYAEAKQYYEAYGDLNVPPGYTAKDGKRLDVWVKSQRRIRNGRILGSLTEDQIKALDRLGMNWTLKRRTLWERHFALAKVYSKKHGNLNIPQTYKEPDGTPLGSWLSKQRTEHNRGALSEEKTAMLQSIGIRWQPYEDRWEVMYAAAKIYYFLHGNINVPQDYIAPDGKHLGQWISVQRQVWNGAVRGALTENRIRQLDALGMRWYLDRNEE